MGKKIAIDIRKIDDLGIGVYIENLVNLVPLYDPFNEYYLLHPNEEILNRIKKTKNIHFIQELSGKYTLSELMFIPQKLSKYKIDLYHSPHYVFPLYIPSKGVVTIHDTIHLKFKQYYTRLQRFYAWFMFRNAVKLPHLIIVDTKAVANELMESLKVPEEKIRIIPLGVSSEFHPRSDEDLAPFKNKYGLDQPYFLYSGSLAPHKNFPALLEMLEKVEPKEDFSLVVIGDHPDNRPSIKALLHSKYPNIKAGKFSIKFVGRVPSADVPFFYCGAYALVFPSLYEGFGLPALEAMACGTPVIAFNIPALAEVVSDAGVFVPLGDNDAFVNAIFSILNDTDLRKAISKKGLKRARAFSWEQTAMETIFTYGEAFSL